jgi:Tfp pilus assembly protein PilN
MKAVNLIPAAQREGASVGAGRSEGAAYAVLGVLAGVAVLALLYGQAKHNLSSRRAQAASLTAQAQSAQAAASQLAPYTTFTALRDQRMAAVDTLVGSRFDWAHAFHEFGRTVPHGVSFTSLQGKIGSGASTATASTPSSSAGAAPATPVASSTPPGSVPTFTLAGCAVNQSTVAQMLQRLRLIDGVSEVSLQSSTASSTSGGSGGGGGCAGHDPVFSVTITFAGLPTPVAPTTSTSTVADSAGSSAASSGSTTTPGSAAR